MKKMILSLPLIYFAFGCQAQTMTAKTLKVDEPIDTAYSNNSCGADELKYLIGKPRTVLHTMKFRGDTRILEHDSMMDMMYSPTRLNIHIDKKGFIYQINCG
jgi:hypothetical protein